MIPPELWRTVALARSSEPHYTSLKSPEAAPELPDGRVETQAHATLRLLFQVWGLDAKRFGTQEWNPLGQLISPGASVVLKPNWVFHTNKNLASGLDCLVTHSSVIAAVLDYVMLARPGRLVLGDAPLQGCDFTALCAACDVPRLVERAARQKYELHVLDFRRTILHPEDGHRNRTEGARDLADYVLFDLEKKSLLESVPGANGRLRVTQYNPDLLQKTHTQGRHQYLIAREIVEADVVVNLPKLKAHMKSGVTGALKNLIGINGNKEFLPHHRKGGSSQGGDCYEGYSFWKDAAERLFDSANRRQGGSATPLFWMAEKFLGLARRTGNTGLVEGAWHGNETIWRTCLDLNRVLLYGRSDGSLADTIQRQSLHITDAIIGGQGEGPLRPDPAPAGFLTGALNPAASEWVNVLLMGWDPRKIPVVRESFGQFPWPIANFAPESIRVLGESGLLPLSELQPPNGLRFRASEGWLGHVEADSTQGSP